MRCKICNEEMLPTGQEYTVEIYECQECGYEVPINEDGLSEIDYREAWHGLAEWLNKQIEEHGNLWCPFAETTKNKMKELINE